MAMALAAALRDDWRQCAFGAADEGEEEDARTEGSSKPRKRKSRLGVDFGRASNPTLTLPLAASKEDDQSPGSSSGSGGRVGAEGGSLLLGQDADSVNLGAVVWDCGILLSKLLCTLGESWMQGKRVYELGSGTGVVGLTAAKLGASHCVLTDIASMVDQLESNVARNGLGDRVQVREYSWGEPLVESKECDVVLCSDVLYERKSYRALTESFKLLVSSPKTQALFALKLRFPEHEVTFFEELESSGYLVQAISVSAIDSSAEGLGLFLVTLSGHDSQENKLTL